MGYGTRSGHGYGRGSRSGGFGGKSKSKKSWNSFAIAKRNFEKRSERSQNQDARMIAQIAPNLSVYLRNPDRFDLPFIDLPQEQSEMIRTICQLANKKPCELHVKDIETKRVKKLKVVKKKDVKAETEKEIKKLEEKAQLAKVNPIVEGPESYVPSEKEIYDEAVRLWMKENHKAAMVI